MDFPTYTALLNDYCKGTMVKVKIGPHDVELYDSIDDLPIVRFHKYQKLLLVESGIGSDITAFDTRTEKIRRFLMDGKPDKAMKELNNLRQCVFFIQNDVSLQNLSFAVLVNSIDGKPCTDLSDDGLKQVCKVFETVPNKLLLSLTEKVKKKIDSELMLYFPSVFNDSSVKEYFDLLKKRTLAVLERLSKGLNPESEEIEKLTTALITYSNPQTFEGSESAEIQFERQFENLCLAMSENLHVKPKEFTVLEFYNAFDFVMQRARTNEKAPRMPQNRR